MNRPMSFKNHSIYVEVERSLKNLTCKISNEEIYEAIRTSMENSMSNSGYSLDRMYGLVVTDIRVVINKLGRKIYSVTYDTTIEFS